MLYNCSAGDGRGGEEDERSRCVVVAPLRVRSCSLRTGLNRLHRPARVPTQISAAGGGGGGQEVKPALVYHYKTTAGVFITCLLRIRTCLTCALRLYVNQINSP